VLRKVLLDEGDDDLLGLKVAFGHRVDGPFQGYAVGLEIALAE
jgi:hypothetical protein